MCQYIHPTVLRASRCSGRGPSRSSPGSRDRWGRRSCPAYLCYQSQTGKQLREKAAPACIALCMQLAISAAALPDWALVQVCRAALPGGSRRQMWHPWHVLAALQLRPTVLDDGDTNPSDLETFESGQIHRKEAVRALLILQVVGVRRLGNLQKFSFLKSKALGCISKKAHTVGLQCERGLSSQARWYWTEF